MIDGADAMDAVTVCLAAARVERSVVLTVDATARPPAPACPDPVHARWLHTPLTRLLGLSRADGTLVDHPALLTLG
ncbi:MAG: hypothetical protein R2755_14560 [Acidimicrobiales bacterium]